MIRAALLLLCTIILVHGYHFNGGTIRWEPINPYINSSQVPITLIQTYEWTYPTILCTNNVPILTPGRSTLNKNLTCMADCSTDGGYSTKPVNILTDCVSSSAALNMMTSSRSANISLNAGAYFYLSYQDSAWAPLNSPAVSGLYWSITTFIDLRLRSDGFINTPPEAVVASPQYVVVNRTTQIPIAVSDANAGDTVRCRWSTVIPGYRRRREVNADGNLNHQPAFNPHRDLMAIRSMRHRRVRLRRSYYGGYGGYGGTPNWCTGYCASQCLNWCPCNCSSCAGTTCSGSSCNAPYSFCPVGTTTPETPGTLPTTSLYPHRQAIDECGGICYPSSVPTGTTLSNCTLSFKGLVPNTWYAVAVQVEDFINSTSNVSMSSVPVQFLIYVMPQPTCSIAPVIVPLTGCMEVAVGVTKIFNITLVNQCNSNITGLADIIVSQGISGMTNGNLTDSLTNDSVSYMIFTWTPQLSQLGSQQLCTIGYTDENVQSAQYCVTFSVVTSAANCITTTTSTSTSTSSTSTSSTSSSTSASTTSTTTTSSSTTSTSTTTTTDTTSTTTSSSTSTSTSTTTSTSSTSATTSTATTSTTTSSTTTKKSPGKSVNWLLILGLSLLGLLLAVCCACCWLYWCLWGPRARRRRQRKKDAGLQGYNYLVPSASETPRSTAKTALPIRRETIGEADHLDDLFNEHDIRRNSRPGEKTRQDALGSLSISRHQGSARMSRVLDADKPLENGNARIRRSRRPDDEVPIVPSPLGSARRSSRVFPLDTTNQVQTFESTPTEQPARRASHVNVIRLSRQSTSLRVSSIDPNSQPRRQERAMPKERSSVTDRRTKPTENSRPRAASMGNVEVIKVKRSTAHKRGTKSGMVARRAGILEKVHSK